MDSAILVSGDIPAGTTFLEFKDVITPEWRDYELRLRNVRPQGPTPPPYNVLFLHVSHDNGITYDMVMGNYVFGKEYVCPDGRPTGVPKEIDMEHELGIQGSSIIGLDGKFEFSMPLRPGASKAFRSFVTYMGPQRFCAEWGGYLYKPTDPINAFRLCYYPGDYGGWPFAGGSYSLWGYK